MTYYCKIIRLSLNSELSGGHCGKRAASTKRRHCNRQDVQWLAGFDTPPGRSPFCRLLRELPKLGLFFVFCNCFFHRTSVANPLASSAARGLEGSPHLSPVYALDFYRAFGSALPSSIFIVICILTRSHFRRLKTIITVKCVFPGVRTTELTSTGTWVGTTETPWPICGKQKSVYYLLQCAMNHTHIAALPNTKEMCCSMLDDVLLRTAHPLSDNAIRP